MGAMKFTDRHLKSLKARTERFVEWEDGVRNLGTLGVRVSPAGRKSWIFMYRFDGKPRMKTLGRYPAMSVAQAHRVTAQLQECLDEGKDPEVAPDAPGAGTETVDCIATEYLDSLRDGTKTRKEFARILTREVLPMWSGRSASGIQRREVTDLVDGISKRPAPVAANRTLAVIKGMYNYALRRGRVETNPASLIPMNPEESRDRFLSEEELRIFFRRLPSAGMEVPTKLALLLILATVQRPGEVVSLEFKELDETPGWWAMPPQKRKIGRRKRGKSLPSRAHEVPISPMASAVFAAARESRWSDRWVFASSRKDGHVHSDSLPKAVARVEGRDRRLANYGQPLFGLEHWVPHDLRRTGTTHMTRLRVDRLITGKLLGHRGIDGSVTASYDRHTYDSQKTEALMTLSKHLESLGFLDAIRRIQEA
jgi:integrase